MLHRIVQVSTLQVATIGGVEEVVEEEVDKDAETRSRRKEKDGLGNVVSICNASSTKVDREG
jgi:hypothetical protein